MKNFCEKLSNLSYQYDMAIDRRKAKETDPSVIKTLTELQDALTDARTLLYCFPNNDIVLCEKETDYCSSQYYNKIYSMLDDEDIMVKLNKQIKCVLRQYTIDKLRKAVYASRNWFNANPKKTISAPVYDNF